MAGFAIGKKLNLGVVGGLTRQIDNLIIALPNVGSAAIAFGAPVVRATDGCELWKSNSAYADFLGIALRIVKTNETYAQNDAEYVEGDTVDILTRGGVAVECVKDTTATASPAPGGAVYIRKATGVFVAAAEGAAGADTIQLTNAVWASGLDANGLAEITLLTRKA